jgi:hypothetical protein
MESAMLQRPPHADFETIVPCGTGADAYQVVIAFPMSNNAARIYLQDRNHPDFKGKAGEELVAEIVKRSMQGSPTIVTRLKNGVKNDGPRGEPAHAIYQMDRTPSVVEHCKDGKLNDSVTGEAAFQVFEKGLLKRAVHYTNNAITMMKQFTYTDAIFKEEPNLTDPFNKAAAPKEWKQCNVTVEYRNADRLTTDGPDGIPGLQIWQMGYELVEGLPADLKFSQQAKLTFAMHYKDGKESQEANVAEKQLLRKQWPALYIN